MVPVAGSTAEELPKMVTSQWQEAANFEVGQVTPEVPAGGGRSPKSLCRFRGQQLLQPAHRAECSWEC